jgi:hypothetical protein
MFMFGFELLSSAFGPPEGGRYDGLLGVVVVSGFSRTRTLNEEREPGRENLEA